MFLTMIVFSPLIFAIMSWLSRNVIKEIGVQCVTSFGVGISMLLSCATFISILDPYVTKLIPLQTELCVLIPLDGYDVYWALRFDPLVKVMLFVVTMVSFLVHIYSIGYMMHDKARSEFMILISLFTFFMLLLVTSTNFIQLFCGWEGVGLCSYLLIGFWHHKNVANEAALKAFIVNRVGDLGLIIAMAVIYCYFGSFDFDAIFEKLPIIDNRQLFMEFTLMDFITLMLFIGAMGKSAQFGLHVWLPDAMEGPTPVSALIHAATMVTAGVFLMVRCSSLLEYAPITKNIILALGTLTAFFGAAVAIAQTDIKRIIAYSTCSQLGYMFMAIGSGFYTGAIFHLYTHAFFKALLFLGAGSIIHAFSDEQNIEKMGNVWKKIPVTYGVMWIGNLSLIGFPFFSGFYSKESILHVLSHEQSILAQFSYFTGLLVAFLTSFYIFRLLFLVFHGKMKAHDKVVAHIHEAPRLMLIPLIVLALLAISIGGMSIHMFLNPASDFWEMSNVALPQKEFAIQLDWILIFPCLGLGMAYMIYIYGYPLNILLKKHFKKVHQFCFRKWFIDELYSLLIVKPIFALAKFFWKTGDEKIIEGFGPKLLTNIVQRLGINIRLLQTGYISDYILLMFGFLIVFVFLSLMSIVWGSIIHVH